MSATINKIILPSGISMETIDWSLYVIIDAGWLNNRSVQNIAEGVIRGGAGVIQYRDKVSDSRRFFENAAIIREVTKHYHIPFVVNDRVDMAVAVASDGVHLGKKDLSAVIARKLVGEEMFIGVSVSSETDLSLCEHGDYAGVGAVFPTETHKNYTVAGLDMITLTREQTELPIVGIGGIQPDNALDVRQAGADGVAVISAILKHDDVEQAAREFVAAMKQ
jgi:thiamine-phosphate pyrophosphorylase